MKQLRTPEENIVLLFSYIVDEYNASDSKVKGSVQFHLTHGEESFDYTIRTAEEMTFAPGTVDDPTASLKSTLFDWLDLSAGRLHPIFGAVTQKLEFSGDTSYFSQVMSGGSFDVDLSEFQDPITPFEKDPTTNWTKPQNVLVVNGSPRKNQGYTHFYLQPFVEGMKKAGANVELVSLQEQEIKPCTGCWNCWIKGTGQCILDDDMQRLYPKYDGCDMLVLAFPLYVDGMPALIKTFLERLSSAQLYPYMIPGKQRSRHPRRKKKDRSLALLSVSGFPELEQFDAVREHIRAWGHASHMPVVAELLRPGGMNIYHNPLHYGMLTQVLDALQKAGNRVVEEGNVDIKTLKTIAQAPDSIEEFHVRANGFWYNIMKEGKGAY
jgi:putative NADPH-quinone reductase/putative sterol carrier protein